MIDAMTYRIRIGTFCQNVKALKYDSRSCSYKFKKQYVLTFSILVIFLQSAKWANNTYKSPESGRGIILYTDQKSFICAEYIPARFDKYRDVYGSQSMFFLFI